MADSFSEEEEEEEPASSGFRDRRSPRVFLDQPSSLLSSPGPARSISFPDDVRFNDFITVAIRFRPVFAPPSVERKADLPFLSPRRIYQPPFSSPPCRVNRPIYYIDLISRNFTNCMHRRFVENRSSLGSRRSCIVPLREVFFVCVDLVEIDIVGKIPKCWIDGKKKKEKIRGINRRRR